MSSEVTNPEASKKPRNPLSVAGEVGLWVAIILLLAVAALQGVSDIAKLQGEGPSLDTLSRWMNAAMWVGIPLAAVSSFLVLTQRHVDEDEASS